MKNTAANTNLIDMAIELRHDAVEAVRDAWVADFLGNYGSWFKNSSRFTELIEAYRFVFGDEAVRTFEDSAMRDGKARFEVWKSEHVA